MITTSIQLHPPQSTTAAALGPIGHSSRCLPCLSGLASPEEIDDAPASTALLRPLIVFAMWQLLAHAPFQAAGGAVAEALRDRIVADGDDGATPWYGIDPILRASTTVADVLRISFWALLGRWHGGSAADDAPAGAAHAALGDGFASSPHGSDEAATEPHGNDRHSTNHGYDDGGDNYREGSSKQSPQSPCPPRRWWEIAVWSTLAWPIRMGRTFESASAIRGSDDDARDLFWMPLRAYGLSRVAALAIGSVPGCIGGVPSLLTSMGLGIYYASYRGKFEEDLELKKQVVGLDREDYYGSTKQQLRHSSTRNLDWGRERLRDVLGYGYFTCFMVLLDTLILEGALAAEKKKDGHDQERKS